MSTVIKLDKSCLKMLTGAVAISALEFKEALDDPEDSQTLCTANAAIQCIRTKIVHALDSGKIELEDHEYESLILMVRTTVESFLESPVQRIIRNLETLGVPSGLITNYDNEFEERTERYYRT